MKTLLIGLRHGKSEWEMIAGPETTVSDQITIREKLMEALPVNDTWSEVQMLSAEEQIKSKVKFMTAKQASDSTLAIKKADIDFQNSRAKSEERARQQDEAIKKKRLAVHEAEVAGLNKQHDAIRQNIAPVSTRAQKILSEAQKNAELELRSNHINELGQKSDGELLSKFSAINSALPQDKRIKLPNNAAKAEIVKAILAIEDLTAEAQ